MTECVHGPDIFFGGGEAQMLNVLNFNLCKTHNFTNTTLLNARCIFLFSYGAVRWMDFLLAPEMVQGKNTALLLFPQQKGTRGSEPFKANSFVMTV